VLRHTSTHQKQVITGATKFRARSSRAPSRKSCSRGYLIALENLDEGDRDYPRVERRPTTRAPSLTRAVRVQREGRPRRSSIAPARTHVNRDEAIRSEHAELMALMQSSRGSSREDRVIRGDQGGSCSSFKQRYGNERRTRSSPAGGRDRPRVADREAKEEDMVIAHAQGLRVKRLALSA